ISYDFFIFVVYLDNLIMSYGLLPVIIDSFRMIVLGFLVTIFLRENINFLASGFILKPNGVGSVIVTVGAGSRIDPHLRGILGQFPRRHVRGVIHPTGNNRIIRVAIDKIHDHFIANPWHLHRPEAATGPGAGNPYPARAVLVFIVVAVPMKAYLDLAIAIGPDLLTFGAHHHRRLRPQRARLARRARWPKRQRGALHGQIEHAAPAIVRRLFWGGDRMVVVLL